MNGELLGALLVVAVAIVFWCLSVVCEERFVPALAVICDVLKIPDDVAGATLMAAGACSPEVVLRRERASSSRNPSHDVAPDRS